MSEHAVHVVVVAYGAPERLDRCLAPLEGAFAATVVDNSSAPEVAAVCARRGARYLDSGANLGFAAAVNLALAQLRDVDADVLLLNPDAVVEPGAVRAMAAFLRRPSAARVAAVAPRQHGLDGAEQRVAWPFPTPARMWLEALGLGRLTGRAQWVTGSVLLLRGEAIADVGCFDERFFLYAEEADWQRRAGERGWTSALCLAARALHAGGATSTDARRRELLFHAAQETYVRKWHGPAGWACYRAAAWSGACARAILLPAERRRAAARRSVLYLRGPRRAAGMAAR